MHAHLERDHVLGYALKRGKKAALGIEPGVWLKLFAFWLQRFDDPCYAKLIVTLHAVQRANDQVDYAEMEAALARLLHCIHSKLCIGEHAHQANMLW